MTNPDEMVKKAEEINYGAIGKMLCGKPLTDDNKAEVEKFNAQYDEVSRMKK